MSVKVPLADADFNILFARVHRLLTELLVGRGLVRYAEQLDEFVAHGAGGRESAPAAGWRERWSKHVDFSGIRQNQPRASKSPQ